MKVSYRVVAFSLVMAIAVSGAVEEPGDLTGIYEGELHFPSHVVRITATLVQTQDHVAGLWSTVFESGSGTITGTVIAGSTLGLERCPDGSVPGCAEGYSDHQRSRGDPRRTLYDHELPRDDRSSFQCGAPANRQEPRPETH